MSIKYIVLGGGGYLGLAALGALYELNSKKYYNINDINEIYSISIGAFIGVIICLKIDWDIVLDYIKNRPWHKIVSVTPDMLLNTMTKKGLFDNSFFQESLKNLLNSVDLTTDITLKELYEYSNITLHIFSIKINNMSLVDFNHKTHPDMKVIDAIYASSTLPFIFQPLWYNDSYYLDGGLLNDYPVDICVKEGAEISEILGIKYMMSSAEDDLPKDAPMLEFSFFLYKKFFRKLRKKIVTDIDNEILIPYDPISIKECKQLLEDPVLREKYINNGKQAVQLFLSNKER
jgi:predicted acylesterase/phospholipase RssA